MRRKVTVISLLFTVIFLVTKHDNPGKLLNSGGLGEFIRRSQALIFLNSLFFSLFLKPAPVKSTQANQEVISRSGGVCRRISHPNSEVKRDVPTEAKKAPDRSGASIRENKGL